MRVRHEEARWGEGGREWREMRVRHEEARWGEGGGREWIGRVEVRPASVRDARGEAAQRGKTKANSWAIRTAGLLG